MAQRTLSCTASIVINWPAEPIFAYLSDPRHHLFESGDAEGQGEEVKHTYRFFGIAVTLRRVAKQTYLEDELFFSEP